MIKLVQAGFQNFLAISSFSSYVRCMSPYFYYSHLILLFLFQYFWAKLLNNILIALSQVSKDYILSPKRVIFWFQIFFLFFQREKESLPKKIKNLDFFSISKTSWVNTVIQRYSMKLKAGQKWVGEQLKIYRLTVITTLLDPMFPHGSCLRQLCTGWKAFHWQQQLWLEFWETLWHVLS